jgi:atypical dual specificity phosphatase
MELRLTRGCLCLVGPQIDKIVQQSLQCLPTILSSFSTDCHTIVLLDRNEVLALSEPQLSNITATHTSRLYSSGVGHSPEAGVYFVVIIWVVGQHIRKKLGFPPKHFHINLSALDVCDGDTGIDSLLPGQFPSNPSADFLNHLAITLNIFGCHQKAKGTSIELVEALLLSPQGFLGLGDAALGMCQYKLAMLSYACAWERTTEYKKRDSAIKKMIKCAKHTEWGPLFLDAEISQLPNKILSALLTPWSAELRMCISELRTTSILHTETLFMVLPTLTSMSHHPVLQYFRWLIPYHIAISALPRGKEDIKTFASPHLQIRHILTLTEETPLDHSWFTGTSITNSYLPTPNYHSPSKEQVEIFFRMSEDESKLPLLVHCGGGRGSYP